MTRPIVVTGGTRFISRDFLGQAITSSLPVIRLDALAYARSLAIPAGLTEPADHVFVDASIKHHGLGWRPAITFEQSLRETVRRNLNDQAWREDSESSVYEGGQLDLGRTLAAA